MARGGHHSLFTNMLGIVDADVAAVKVIYGPFGALVLKCDATRRQSDWILDPVTLVKHIVYLDPEVKVFVDVLVPKWSITRKRLAVRRTKWTVIWVPGHYWDNRNSQLGSFDLVVFKVILPSIFCSRNLPLLFLSSAKKHFVE